jgi:hypothetical protein
MTDQTTVPQIATDDLLEKALVDLLMVWSFDEVLAGTRTRRLRKDKAERAARQILATLNRATDTTTIPEGEKANGR